jgi:sporulation protein YlmC with PRC-barrel domain
MLTRILTATALATVLAAPAFAQSSAPLSPPAAHDSSSSATQANPGSGMDKNASTQRAGFVQSQSADEWRASKLIGTSVYGPDNKSIGEINDVVIASNGGIKAVVVGVGGFLGVGEKNVALPFDALHVQRKENSASIEKITVSFNKDELKNAPNFAYYQASGSSTTTGSSTTQPRTAPSAPAGSSK